MSEVPARLDPYIAWRSADYRLYALSWFLMVFGKAIETIAIQEHLYVGTKDPMALGWIGLVQALPVMLFAIAGGQLADRYDRRRLLMVMLGLSTLVSIGLTLAVAREASHGWIYALLFLGAINAALGTPSRAALLPQIVPAEHFGNAVTWNSSIFQIGSMTGPAIAGLIIGRELNTHYALMMVVVCRILSLVTIAGLRTHRSQAPTEALSWESMVAGVRFVKKTKLILAAISLDLFAVLLGGAVYLVPVFAEDILQVGAPGLGFLRSAEAMGAVVMAVLLAHLPPMKHAGRTLLASVAGFGVATIVFGLSTSFWLSLAMMFLLGAFDNVSVVVRHTLVQMLTPDFMRGRVSAVNSIFIVASNDLGGLESGATAKIFGSPVRAVVFGGVGSLLVVAAAARIWPQLLTIGKLKDVRPAEDADSTLSSPQEAAT
jgi:MFS family permease